MDRSFLFDADDLCLDFLNTRRWEGDAPRDFVASPDRVVAWLRETDLATPEDEAFLRASPPDARVLFDEAHRLRDGVEAMATSLTGATLVPEWAVLTLNRVLALESSSRRVAQGGASFELHAVVERRGPVGLLAPVAGAAAELLTGGDPSRIRRCDACGLWFRDVSKNGRRRWCSMARCGNRAKVAAHYKRRSA